jgi:DNA repair protein RecN (Recombination protein N)
MIFDEIDSGISGATANAVGERLARLGSRMQVLVVTHAPQVAARAKHHWRVTKSSRGTKTSLKLDELAGQHRIEEVARMLSGAAVTEEARAAAESLLGGPPS